MLINSNIFICEPVTRNMLSGVARICCEEGQRWKLCHGTLTADFRAGCSSCSMTNTFVTNAVLIERAVSY